MYEQPKQRDQEQEIMPAESQQEDTARLKGVFLEAEGRYRENPQKGEVRIGLTQDDGGISYRKGRITGVTDAQGITVVVMMIGGVPYSFLLECIEEAEPAEEVQERARQALLEAAALYRENPQKGNVGIAYLTNSWHIGFMPAQIAEVTDTEVVLVGGGTFPLAYVEEVEFVDAGEERPDAEEDENYTIGTSNG